MMRQNEALRLYGKWLSSMHLGGGGGVTFTSSKILYIYNV